MIPVQSTVQPTTRPKELPSRSENVYERLDSSIPSLVQRLFPTQSCALHYLVGLLAHAHVKQYALPTISRETEGDVAIVCVKDYQELRRLLRLAYETAHMYTLIFEALGLLKVEKCKGQLKLVIPLRPYHPPTELLSKLGQLREHYRSHRPHVGRLVETVIERLGDLERDEMQQLHRAQDAFSAELVDLIEQALAAEGVQGDTRQIAQRIAATTLHHFLVERGQTTSTMVKGVTKRLPTVITANEAGLQVMDARIRSRLSDTGLVRTVSLDEATDYRPHRAPPKGVDAEQVWQLHYETGGGTQQEERQVDTSF